MAQGRKVAAGASPAVGPPSGAIPRGPASGEAPPPPQATVPYGPTLFNERLS